MDWLFENARNIEALLAIPAIVFGIALYAWRKMLQGKKQFDAIMHAVGEIRPVVEKVSALERRVDEIRDEFRTNGGSSMSDKIGSLRSLVMSVVSRQRHFTDGHLAPMWESDAAGNCTLANRALLDLTERRVEDLLGSNWENIIYPEDRSKVWAEWNEAVARKRTFELTYRVNGAKSGKTHRVTAVAYPIFDGSIMTGFTGMYRQVQELPSATASHA